jgi:hypothetical protein
MVDELPSNYSLQSVHGLLVDQQAALAFGVGSTDCQILLNNTVAQARTATAFELPIVISTSAGQFDMQQQIGRRPPRLRLTLKTRGS